MSYSAYEVSRLRYAWPHHHAYDRSRWNRAHPVRAFAADYARDRALRPFAPGLSYGLRARDAAHGIAAGAWAISAYRGQPAATVGGEWWHSSADKKRAAERLTIEFQALSDDLASWMHEGKQGDAAAPAAIAQWITVDVTPTINEWHQFLERQLGSWWSRAATDWGAYEDWWDRLRRLRELARAHGIVLTSPEPVPLPKTIWQRGTSGRGNEAAVTMGLLKMGIAAALGITGIVGFYAILRDIRGRP